MDDCHKLLLKAFYGEYPVDKDSFVSVKKHIGASFDEIEDCLKKLGMVVEEFAPKEHRNFIVSVFDCLASIVT